MTVFPGLSGRQEALLAHWLPGVQVIADYSWGLLETRVLHLRHRDGEFIAKASGPGDHHLDRELRAHREWLHPWTRIGRAPRLVHADAEAKLLVTTFLPGELVLGTAAERDPDTFAQAGELLALFTGNPGRWTRTTRRARTPGWSSTGWAGHTAYSRSGSGTCGS